MSSSARKEPRRCGRNCNDRHSRRFAAAKQAALARSGGVCQGCGLLPATEAHRWALDGPCGCHIASDDLTAYCRPCVAYMQQTRSHAERGGSLLEMQAAVAEAVRQLRRPQRHLEGNDEPQWHPSQTATDLRTLTDELVRLAAAAGPPPPKQAGKHAVSPQPEPAALPEGATRFLTRHEVEEMVGFGRTTIYKMMSEGKFPKPVKISPKCVRWPADEVESWLNDRIAERGRAV